MCSTQSHRRRARRHPLVAVLAVVQLTIGAFALLPADVEAQSGPHAVLSGVVTTTDGELLEGALISLTQLHRTAITDARGHFRFADVPPGTYTVIVWRIGYGHRVHTAHVSAGRATRIDMALEPSAIELQPMVVTATARAAADPLTTAADIDVLGGREKMARETPALGAFLDALPGVASISTGMVAGKPVIRGLSGNRIRILRRGVGMDYQQYGTRHSPPVDPHLVERVEVVRGASSVLYGSDALGGAVNMIPHDIPNAVGRPAYLSGRMGLGVDTNNQQASGSLRLDGAAGGFGWTGALVRRSAGNMRVPDVLTALETGVGTDPRFTGELPFTDYDQTTACFGVGYRWGTSLLAADYFGWRDERNFLLPGGGGVGQGLTDDAVQLRGSFLLGDKWAVRPVTSIQRNVRLANDLGSPRDLLPEAAVVDLSVWSSVTRLEAEHQTIAGFTGRMGLEYMLQNQDTRGSEPLHPAATVKNASVYAFEEVRFGPLTVEMGVRFDHRRQEAEANAELRLPDFDAGETQSVLSQSYKVFSGALGMSYRVGPHMALTANLGRGFRAPSIFELHAYGVHGGVAAFQVGDPSLTAETSLNTDVSMRWHSQRFVAKVTAYRNFLDGYIYLMNTGEIEDRSGLPIHQIGQDDAVLWGGDVSVQAQLLPWLQLHGVVEGVEGTIRDTDQALPLLPALQSQAGLVFSRPEAGPVHDLRFDITVRRAEQKDAAGPYEPFWQFDQNPDFGVASTPAYTLLDAAISLEVPVQGSMTAVHVIGTNLTDCAYRDFLDTYKGYALSAGRNVTVKVDVPFGGH